MRHNTSSDFMGDYAHTPVMWRETLGFIRDMKRRKGVLVDCTLGEGGHSELILKEFHGLRIIGFERDGYLVTVARRRLGEFGPRMEVINDNFANAALHLGRLSEGIVFFLYDLGISSYHFERSGRGFSFRDDEPLDMRLDQNARLDAAAIVNGYAENELTDIFKRYGEERWAGRIARRICAARAKEPIKSSGELARLVLRAIPKRYHVRNIHPATRIFQALRIAVNDELSAIESSLHDACSLLSAGGRICAISFHSLEDRIVKTAFRGMASGCSCGLPPRQCVCGARPLVRILTRKPLSPGADEIAANNRARSAKMRVCEKL